MPATQVLSRDSVFRDVPLKATKRGFSIPRPAVLRTSQITGSDNPKDKEWDGRSASFTWNPQSYYTGTMTYQVKGKAGFTKSITSVTEVDRPGWNDAMRNWRQFLHDHAEDFTNTHARVTAGITNNATLIARNVHGSNVPNPPATPTPAPTPDPVALAVTASLNGTALPMKTWDPNDLDLAHDLYEVPDDNPNFLPDPELFEIMDALWEQAMATDEPRMLLIYGDTSTGKTEHPIIWAARRDALHCRIDCGAFGEIYDVTGPIKASASNGVSVTEWIKGKTIRAMADPRPAVLQLDEVNRISDVKAMNTLFPFFDSARQSYFDDAQKWMKLNGVKLIIATMNGDTRGDDIGEYVGTQPLDQAFISRFPNRKQLRYPDAQKLAQILEARNSAVLPPDTIKAVAEIAVELVALNKFVPNLRELFAALDLLKQGKDLYKALKWTVGGIYKNDGTAACDFVSFRSVLIGKQINCDDA